MNKMKAIILGSLLTLATFHTALAVDFSQKIKAIDGGSLTDGEGKKQPDITLKTIATSSLLAAFPDEASLSGEDKFKRWQLASKIQSDKTDDLSIDDLALIKKLVAKFYTPLVVGQAWLMLDPSLKTSDPSAKK